MKRIKWLIWAIIVVSVFFACVGKPAEPDLSGIGEELIPIGIAVTEQVLDIIVGKLIVFVKNEYGIDLQPVYSVVKTLIKNIITGNRSGGDNFISYKDLADNVLQKMSRGGV